MRYFLLKTDPKYNTSPVIENWYPKIDVRLIRKETGHKLPKRELLLASGEINHSGSGENRQF